MSLPRGGRSFATTRPVAILVVFLAAGVFGLLSYSQLPLSLMPELTYPTLTVRTEYAGAAPEEVENDVSRPVEEALGVIGGLRQIKSVSRAGVSDVVLEFAWDTDMSDATQEVLEKLDRVFLPDETERPLILHYDPSLDPVIELSLSGEGPRFEGESGLRRLRRIAELQVKRMIEPVKGVAAARVRGGLEEEIHVLLEEEQLRRTGLSIQTVIDRLAQENVNVAGGTLKEGRTEYLVRTLNEYGSIEEIENTVVALRDGREIRVRDVGRVARTHKDREIVTRTDGGPSVQIDIYKEGDANIVALAGTVRGLIGDPGKERLDAWAASGFADEKAVEGLAASLYREEGVMLDVVADRSVFIEQSVREVKTTAVLGGLLAIVVLFLFLRNVKSTVIVAVSIPTSLLIAFAPIHLMGVSLNIMSLGGLALGVGMLVDSSIVVLESIFRCREEGDDVEGAAVRGTKEVRGAVFASTLTSIAVFAPMVFVEGVAGQAFGDLGIAVVVSLVASVAVALYLIPMLASRRGISTEGVRTATPELSRTLLRFAAWRAFVGGTRAVVRFVKAATAGSAVRRASLSLRVPAALVAGVYLLARLVIGTVLELAGKLVVTLLYGATWLVWGVVAILAFAFRYLARPPVWIAGRSLDAVAKVYPRVLRAALAAPVTVVVVMALCLWGTWELARALDSELLPEVRQGEFTVEVALPVGTPIEETESLLSPVEDAILEERDGIEALLLTLGYDSSNSQRSDEGEHTARFKVLLDAAHRTASAEDAVVARLRERFDRLPDVDARIVRPVLFSEKTPIEIEVHGDDLVELRRQADLVRARVASLPELTDVESSLRAGAPEVQIVYDRDRLTGYGLDIGDVARLVRDKVKGYEATRYNMKDRRIPIVVRLGLDDRETVEEIRGLVVNPGGARPIPLSAVASVRLGEGPSEVRRIDGERVAVVRANLAPGESLSRAADRIDAVLASEVDWPSGTTFLISGQNEEWERSRKSLWLALGLSVFLVYVIMAAQFESLVHPFVIMLTIPLAFLGSVAALHVLGISLSVVVFLGMIMLAGIVVNNAIVLVDYINRLRARGLERRQAILQAGSVRLRPILMTTATTVLGLLPLALGVGEGAELRTPMAITVISGLIVSTVLTLVLIPTVYAVIDGLRDRLFGRTAAVAPSDRSGVPDGVADGVPS